MTTQTLAIVGSGMVTGVGLSAAASCAAIRCAINDFQETKFIDEGGEWIIGSSVPLEQSWRGITKLTKILASALKECASSDPDLTLDQVPILLCLAEENRPGHLYDLNNQVYFGAEKELGMRFHEKSVILNQGRVGVAIALKHARQLIYEQKFPAVIIAGVDSLVNAQALTAFEEQERLLTSKNSNGFIPGEAAAAILVRMPKTELDPQLVCIGLGFGIEKARIDSDLPLRADGLVDAFNEAFGEAGCNIADLDYRIADISGEQYWFKETALALGRTLRIHKDGFELWHPADSIGETGAAIGPVIFSVAMAATRKAYAPGTNILCHFASDDGKRAAVVLTYQYVRAS